MRHQQAGGFGIPRRGRPPSDSTSRPRSCRRSRRRAGPVERRPWRGRLRRTCTPAASSCSRCRRVAEPGDGHDVVVVLAGERERDGQADLAGRTGDEITRRRRPSGDHQVRRVSASSGLVSGSASGRGRTNSASARSTSTSLAAAPGFGRRAPSSAISGLVSFNANRPNWASQCVRPPASASATGAPTSSAWIASSNARWKACQRAGYAPTELSTSPPSRARNASRFSDDARAPGREQFRCRDVVEVADAELVRGREIGDAALRPCPRGTRRRCRRDTPGCSPHSR